MVRNRTQNCSWFFIQFVNGVVCAFCKEMFYKRIELD